MLNFIEEAKLKSLISSGVVTYDHIADYLQGVNYTVWANSKDLEVDIYDTVDVSAQVVQWKKDNYASLRESEYPSWKEFADAYVKDDVTGMDAYKAKCLAVKVKYPK